LDLVGRKEGTISIGDSDDTRKMLRPCITFELMREEEFDSVP
jgi:hypothetical protein